jgi:hypothetical protein
MALVLKPLSSSMRPPLGSTPEGGREMVNGDKDSERLIEVGPIHFDIICSGKKLNN